MPPPTDLTPQDPAMTLGLSVFETLYAEAGRPRALWAHLRRLEGSARAIGAPPPDLARVADELKGAAAGARGACALRYTLSQSGASWLTTRALDLALTSAPRSAAPITSPPSPFLPRTVKHSSRAEWRLAARALEVDEVLLCDLDGEVLEADQSSVFFLYEGVLISPPDDGRRLRGVARAGLLEAARGLGVPVVVAPLSLRAPREAIVLTSALKGVTRVGALKEGGVGAQSVDEPPPPPLLARLAAASREVLWGMGVMSVVVCVCLACVLCVISSVVSCVVCTTRECPRICASAWAEPAVREAGGEPSKPWLTVGALITTEGATALGRARAPGAPRAELRHLAQLALSLEMRTSSLELGRVVSQGLGVREDRDVQAGNPAFVDLHAYSNLRAEDRLELFELFWEREVGGWIFRGGKVDANDHFAVSEHEAHLINGAAGYSPSIFGMPSYPDSAWCAQVGVTSTRADVLLGVFDGGATELSPTPTGSLLWVSPAVARGGLFYVGQLTLHLGALHAEGEEGSSDHLAPTQSDRGFVARAPYHLTVGAWTHRGRVVGGEAREGLAPGGPSWGVYVTSDLTLGVLNGGEVGVGLQGALSPAYHPLHVSLALTWDDALPPLSQAPAGLSVALGLSHLRVAEGVASSFGVGATQEALVELTAMLPVFGWLTVSLSGVYLRGAHLGGGGEALAVVGRVTVGEGELFVLESGLGALPRRVR
jgi:branched-chain amino acid aminotransferase